MLLEEFDDVVVLLLLSDLQGSLTRFILDVRIRPGVQKGLNAITVLCHGHHEGGVALVVLCIDADASLHEETDCFSISTIVKLARKERRSSLSIAHACIGAGTKELGNRFHIPCVEKRGLTVLVDRLVHGQLLLQ